MRAMEERFTNYLQEYKNFEFTMSVHVVYHTSEEKTPIIVTSPTWTVYVSYNMKIILHNMGKTLLHLIKHDQGDVENLIYLDSNIEPFTLRRGEAIESSLYGRDEDDVEVDG